MTKLTQMSLDEEGGLGRRRIHLREISGDSELPLETVGQDLRAARLRMGQEIATVSRALKIRKDHLEALEQDRLEDLPGKTYAIGFVRSYARHLGLDADRFVERFKQDISGRHEDPLQPPPVLHIDDQRRLPYGWRIIAGFVVLLLGYGAWHLLTADRDSNQAIPPAPVLTPPAPKPLPAPTVLPAPPAASNMATPAPALDTTETQAPLSGGQAAIPPPAEGPTTPATRIAPRQSLVVPGTANVQAAEPAVPAATGGQVYGLHNKGARVVLRARGATHVEVRGPDGKVYINRTLGSGDSYHLPNLVGLRLTSSNAGAVEVDLDGLAMGSAGADMQSVAGLALDPQAIVDRFNRRR
jgi:cytoskeleton protein RodZ